LALPGVHAARLCITACTLAFGAACAAAGPDDSRALTFTEALRIGEQHSARLAAQQAAIDAASEQVPRATELPDPKLRFGIDNLPVTNPDAFTLNRDFMTMRRIGYMQDMPNAEKRQARGDRAERERRVEVATLAARKAQVREETAVAWLELYYAQQTAATLEDLVTALRFEADTNGPGVAAGRTSPSTALAPRVAVEAAADRVLDQKRAVERARAALAALIGDAAARTLGSLPDTGALAHSAESLVTGIELHPAQRIFEEREALAESEVA